MENRTWMGLVVILFICMGLCVYADSTPSASPSPTISDTRSNSPSVSPTESVVAAATAAASSVSVVVSAAASDEQEQQQQQDDVSNNAAADGVVETDYSVTSATRYSLFLSCYATAIVLLMNKVWSRREMQPLKFRDCNFVLLSACSGLVLVWMVCVREPAPERFPCVLYFVIAMGFLATFFTPYLLNCVRLIFVHHTNIHRDVTQGGIYRSGLGGGGGSSSAYVASWYAKHYWWSSKRAIYTYMLLVIVFYMILGVFIWIYLVDGSSTGVVYGAENTSRMTATSVNGTTAETTETTTVLENGEGLSSDGAAARDSPEQMLLLGCRMNTLAFVPMAVTGMVLVLAFLVFFYLLRGIEDLHGTSREMRRCLLLWVACSVLFFVCNLWPPLFWVQDYVPASSWVVAMVVGTNFFSVVVPLFESYMTYPKQKQITQQLVRGCQYKTLDDLIQDEEARVWFSDFMTHISIKLGEVQMLARRHDQAFRVTSSNKAAENAKRDAAKRSGYIYPAALIEQLIELSATSDSNNTPRAIGLDHLDIYSVGTLFTDVYNCYIDIDLFQKSPDVHKKKESALLIYWQFLSEGTRPRRRQQPHHSSTSGSSSSTSSTCTSSSRSSRLAFEEEDTRQQQHQSLVYEMEDRGGIVVVDDQEEEDDDGSLRIEARICCVGFFIRYEIPGGADAMDSLHDQVHLFMEQENDGVVYDYQDYVRLYDTVKLLLYNYMKTTVFPLFQVSDFYARLANHQTLQQATSQSMSDMGMLDDATAICLDEMFEV